MILVTVPAEVQMIVRVGPDNSVNVLRFCVVPDQHVELSDLHVEVLEGEPATTHHVIDWMTNNEYPSPMPVLVDGLDVE